MVNELDMISTILLPPDNTPENKMQINPKQNTYFKPPNEEDWKKYKYGSLMRDYQKVSGNQVYKIWQERDVLSSQYSSVASTIVPDRNFVKDLSPSLKSMNNINRNFIIRQVSHKTKGKGGKRLFPKDFFTG
ncbi:MAG: hypothetical protein ACI9QD_001272 [Thermoproteota archaeon]